MYSKPGRALRVLPRLQGFDSKVTLEFTKNLNNGTTMVKSRKMHVNEEVLVEAIGLPTKGEK